MATNRTCDGVRRRDFLKVGLFAGTGLSLASYLRLVEGGEIAAQGAGPGHLGDSYSSGGGTLASGHVRPEAGRAGGGPG